MAVQRGYIRLESNKGIDGLACEVVGGSNDGGLSDSGVKNERGLDLGSRQTMARNVDNI